MPREIDPKNFNKEAAEAATAAVYEKTGGVKPEDDDEDMWNLWYDVYEAKGGKVIYTEPKGKKPATVTEKCKPSATTTVKSPPKPSTEGRPLPKTPPLKLEIIEMTFLTDHGLMKDNDTDWDNTGNLFAKPDWTPAKSNPISHSLDKKMMVKLVITATGSGKETGKIACKLGDNVAFPAHDVTFSVGRNELTLTGKNIGGKPAIVDMELEWVVKTDRRPKSETIGTTKNEVYVTFSDPVPRVMEPDDGVTLKRMKTSINAIKSSKEADPQKIVAFLMGLFPAYTLKANATVPKRYGHPHYTDPKAGAWPMAQYRKQTAECQAICRFVRGILDQVGCPGVVEPVVVWCDPDPLVAKEAPYGQGGLRFTMKTISKEIEIEEQVTVDKDRGAIDWLLNNPAEKMVVIRKKKIVKKETWSAFLTTSAAMVGNDASGSGLNLYEACLKFTHNGTTKYYGGGAGSFDTKEEVVGAFHSLIWVHQVPQDENDRFSPMVPICKEIVQTF